MIRFNEAGTAAVELAESVAQEYDSDVIVVRDLLGRNALAIKEIEPARVEELRESLREKCSPFVGAEPVILLSEMFAPELITESDELRRAPERIAPSGKVRVLERSALSSDWIGQPLSRGSSPHRIALYGFKGGVTRSTATFALAHHLARAGKVVLVVDLDLESPGITSMLAPHPYMLPEHGIIDHLVEYPLRNDEDLDLTVHSMAAGALDGNGEVWLAPAAGTPNPNGDGYLDKLSRVYFDLPADATLDRNKVTFAERIEAAVLACEKQVAERSRAVDVVLLDSRSGIHDIAAVAITQLSTLALLFATDNTQTWNGYSQLFSRWGQRLDPARRDEIRQKLQMVAPLVPKEYEAYLRRFTDNAQECFARTLYDEPPAGSFQDVFNFAPSDESAPHFPIPIRHIDDLVGLVPGADDGWVSSDVAQLAYGEFVTRVEMMIQESSNV
ncbi:AAA domain-containing protein [Brevibacterium sanguinis]|uniref:AAA domain-containing protein n=2 Tax=Brevibacterium TaxID=1696 RepID=A0A366IM98_9MICO|nr:MULTISPECIES: AAA family ATPase [Brevibacterium]RBP67097.1 AAA domain-containing protein [Brevibacterium sanguinis]RBP73622.1 AAA domain-containing protein [Brevibacterium celere]